MRQGLPYGVVMATAGTSTMARQWELYWLAGLLLAMAMAQAGGIAVLGAWRHRSECRLGWPTWWKLGPPREHTGIHTVPLGLAVIAGGLLGTSIAVLRPVALVSVGLAWLTTGLAVGRFIAARISRGQVLERVDGSWFLVPASLLGIGQAGEILVESNPSWSTQVLAAPTVLVTLLGWLGYGWIGCTVSRRLYHHGLTGAPRAPWWIGMGCAGLAAAALASLHANPILADAWQRPLRIAVVVTLAMALILLMPVAGHSLNFLFRHCHFQGKAVWPPTFSTAVLALGLHQSSDILNSALLASAGQVASGATLLLWLATMSWNLIFRRLRPRKTCSMPSEG